jgi:hypothetical protein
MIKRNTIKKKNDKKEIKHDFFCGVAKRIVEEGVMVDRGKYIKIDLDGQIMKLKRYSNSSKNSVDIALRLHKQFICFWHYITGKNNRSFVSKYLHFHCPDRFFIYDSRAVKEINKCVSIKGQYKYDEQTYDVDYMKFYIRMLALQKYIKDNDKYSYKEKLTPRQIDNWLLWYGYEDLPTQLNFMLESLPNEFPW